MLEQEVCYQNSSEIEIVAIAEPKENLRYKLEKLYNIPKENIYSDYVDMLSRGVIAKDFIIEDNKIKNVIPGEEILNYKCIFKKFMEYGIDISIISEEVSDDKAFKAFENSGYVQYD